METMTIATIITSIGSILTGVLGWFGDVITFLVTNPLILFFILAPMAYAIVPKAYRLVRKGTGRRKA
jgi:hypothetical protein